MKFSYLTMNKSYNETNYKQIENLLFKLEQLIANISCYLDHLKSGQGEQILSEKQKFFKMPVYPKVVDAIMRSPIAKTPQQKLDMANKVKTSRLAKTAVRNSIIGSMNNVTDDELVLSWINQNTNGQPYKIVPDAATGNKK